MQKVHDPPGRSSGWHRVGQTSLKPERLFRNNLQKSRSGCGCGQCHLFSGGSCLCALTPPWPASSPPLGPAWGRDRLEVLWPPSAPEKKVPGGLCPGARSCRVRTRAQDYRRAGECSWQRAAACAIRAWETFVWRLPMVSYRGPPGGASEDRAVWCIERKVQSCLQTVRARLGAARSSSPLGHLQAPRTQVPVDMNISLLLCSACPGEEAGVPV